MYKKLINIKFCRIFIEKWSKSSNLDSSKIKSESFTATVDDYSQIAIRVPNKTILFAVTDTYMLVLQNISGDFRVFGPLAYKKLDPVSKVTVITGIAYYI